MSKPKDCYGCEDRELGCHAWCDRYKRMQARNEAKKARQREDREIGAYVHNRMVNNLDFAAKARRDAAGRSKPSGGRK